MLAMLIVTQTVAGNDWTKWRGPNGNGIVRDNRWNPKALSAQPKIVWEKQLGLGYSAVAVKGDRLYTMGNKEENRSGEDIVYCFHATTGKEIWRFTYPCTTSKRWPGPTATPVLDGNRLYTICDDTGDLYCLNANNGKVLWHRNVVKEFGTVPPYDGVGYAGSPLIEDDLVIFNLNQAGIAFNKMTGKTVWASASGRCSFSTPVIFNDRGKRKLSLFGAKKLFVMDIKTGKVEGAFPWDTNCNENTADPIIVGDKVFISSAYGKGCALLQMTDRNPKLVWKNMEMNSQFQCNVYLNGYVYGIDGERPRCNLKCIDYNTGKVMWSQKMPFGSLIVANGKLLILDEDGVIHVAEATPNSYQEISRGRVQPKTGNGNYRGANRRYWWTNPVLVDGYLYLRSDKGDLVCLDVKR